MNNLSLMYLRRLEFIVELFVRFLCEVILDLVLYTWSFSSTKEIRRVEQTFISKYDSPKHLMTYFVFKLLYITFFLFLRLIFLLLFLQFLRFDDKLPFLWQHWQKHRLFSVFSFFVLIDSIFLRYRMIFVITAITFFSFFFNLF